MFYELGQTPQAVLLPGLGIRISPGAGQHPDLRYFQVYSLAEIFYKLLLRCTNKLMSGRSAKVLPQGMPDCLKKRRLLNEKALDPELCRDYGEKYLALGFWEDALEFFLLGNCQTGLEQIKAQALESGDAYLMTRLGPQSPELWRQLADQALKQGKIHFARRALEAAGDQEQAEELSSRLQVDGP